MAVKKKKKTAAKKTTEKAAKKKSEKKTTTKATKAEKHYKDLPPGGVWRTIRGAHVYILNGKVIAGANGKLSDFDMKEIQAIHDARAAKKTYDNIIFIGTEVKVGRERKVGKVVGETKTQYHIDYGDGKIRKVKKDQVRRADAYKLKIEEKLHPLDGTSAPAIKLADPVMTEEKQKHHEKMRKEEGAVAKPAEEFAEDLVGTPMGETPFTSIKAPMLKRDKYGNPIKEPVFDENGNPVIDPYTGQQKMKYVTYEKEDATEDEILRDHQGLIISEIVNPYAKHYGLEYIQRQWYDEYGRPIDLYGDLVQTANIGFLQGLREYAYKAAQGEAPKVGILAHALMRSKLYVKRHAQNLFSDVKLPEKLLAPLSIVSATEEGMYKVLGRKPTLKEMVEGIEGVPGLKDNPVFNSLEMNTPPIYDPETGKFKEAGKKITDPLEKLQAIYNAKRIQNAVSLETAIAGDNLRGDEEVKIADTVADENETGADKRLLAKLEAERLAQRQRDLKKELNKLMSSLLDEREMELIIRRFGLGNSKQKGVKELSEVAEEMGISLPLAKKISASAMKKLRNAPPEKLETLKKLYMTKSIDGMEILMKSLYALDIQDLLKSFDLDASVLEPVFVRTATGTMEEIEKSLWVTEFIGSVVKIEGSDLVRAQIVEYRIPGDVLGELQKSYMKNSDPKKVHKAIQKYTKEHPEWHSKHAKTQREAIEERKAKGHPLTWSEQLLLDNPGSAWITWHGAKVLIKGDGNIVYSSMNSAHRAKYHPNEEEPNVAFDMEDSGQAAFEEETKALRDKWVQKDEKGNLIGGFLAEWRRKHAAEGTFGVKDKEKKVHPDGWFLAENPENGKRVAYKVEITEGKGGKGKTTKVVLAFDPDADEKINIGDWNAIYKYLGYEKGTGNAYEKLMNDANKEGKHRLHILDEEEFNDLYSGTTEGAVANMKFKKEKIVETTPKRVKVTEFNPMTKKLEAREIDFDPTKMNRIFEADLGDGRIAKFEIRPDGTFSDPVMQKLINPVMPIRDANDLYKALKDAIGNETWVTISSSKTDQLNHYVKLRFDGQGAPIVVGGAFDGFRFQDAAEVDDPEEKQRSLFRNGQPVRPGIKNSEPQEMPIEPGMKVKVRNPLDKRRWIEVKVIERRGHGKHWLVEIPLELREKGIMFKDGATAILPESEMRRIKKKLPVAKEAPVVDVLKEGALTLSVPSDMRADVEANTDIQLDENGRATISLKQFMELRDIVGGFSMTNAARDMIEDFVRKQLREGMPDVGKLLEKYSPNNVSGYKDSSFLKKTNFYTAQVEGMDFLVRNQKAVAAYGMGTGKTLLGVGASMYLRDQALKAGETPKKTVIVSPAGIVPEWLKEINRHTEVGAVVIGANEDHGSHIGQVKDGEDLRSMVVGADNFHPDKVKEHFIVMSYERFTKVKDKLEKWAKEGKFANIIVDEVHNFKTGGGRRNNALKELAASFDNVWGLSGTPMDNDVTDIYHVVDAVTGGVHDLGSREEFNKTYLYREGNKVVGLNESKMDELSKKLAKYTLFRNGYTDTISYVDPETGEHKRVHFPDVEAPNRYHGEVRHTMEFEVQKVKRGEHELEVKVPKPATEREAAYYKRYAELEKKYLTDAQRQALDDVVTSGMEKEESKSYLPAVQKLQQYLNAPLSEYVYWEPKVNSEGKPTGERNYNAYVIDKDGYKRYYKAKFDADGKVVGYETDHLGNPVLLPPLHYNNPKADYLKKVIMDHLAEHENEMKRRTELNKKLKPGEKPLPIYAPKIVITSQYTTFGTDVVEGVIKDICKDKGWEYGKFTGDTAGERDKMKTRFQTDPNFPFMIISEAGKEGIDLGNAHMLIHYDQDFNPNKMAQLSARELRSDSWKHAEREGRPNRVKLVSIAVPGTIEDKIIAAQDRKMENMDVVERAVRKVEGYKEEADYVKMRAGSQRAWGQKKKTAKPKMVIYRETEAEKEAAADRVAEKSLKTLPLVVRIR